MNHQFLPSYTIGTDAYDSVYDVCRHFGKTAVLIGGHKSRAAAEPALRKALEGKLEILDSLYYGGDATFENAEMLKQNEAFQKADMVFAMGGGRAIDTVKKAAGETGKPYFTFPTLASNCAPVTAVGAYYHEDHTFRQVYYVDRPSFHTFINTDVIAHAPKEYLWAGIGDALSKQYEVLFSSRGDEVTYGQSLGIQLAGGCSAGLLKYGEEALAAVDEKTVNYALEYVAQNIICSTGIISNLEPEDYNSSVAHALYNSHTGVAHEGAHLHGAVVCYGTLVLLTLDGQLEERNKLYEFCRHTGLPHSLKDIGLTDPTELINNALPKPDLFKVPYPITGELLAKAIADVEALGK